jgi:hypothetical protein
MTCFQSLFMGDVVADDDYTLDLSNGTTTVTISIPKGSWFANAYTFWLYCTTLHGAVAVDFLQWSNDQLEIFFTVVVTTTWTSGTGNMPAEVGAVALSSSSATEPIPNAWETTFAPSEYTRGVEIHGGSTQRAQDGTAYTVAGLPHETRTMRLVLDRRSGAYEDTLLLNLHRNLWRVGRSVSFYPETITDTNPAWDGTGFDKIDQYGDGGSGRFESLVLPQDNQNRWRSERLVDCKDVVNLDQGTKFYLRQPLLLTDPLAVLRRIM